MNAPSGKETTGIFGLRNWFFFFLFFLSLSCAIFSLVKIVFAPVSVCFACLVLILWIVFPIRLNLVSILTLCLSFIRYEVLPVVYFTGQEGERYSWYASVTVNNPNLVQLIYFGEMIAIIFGLMFFDCLSRKRGSTLVQKTPEKTGGHYLFIVLTFVGLILICLFPRLIPFVTIGRMPTNAITAVFRVCLICFFLCIYSFVRKTVHAEILQIIVQSCFFLVFVLFSTISSTGGIGRNIFVINLLIFLTILIKDHPAFKRPILLLSCFGGFLAFCLLSYAKMVNKTFDFGFVSRIISIYTRYGFLNAYFAGPSNLDTALSMMSSQNIHGVTWLIKDIFANFPFIYSYISDKNTVGLYNLFVYHGRSTQDIVPFVAQSLIYFGPILYWLLPFLMTFSSQKLFSKSICGNDHFLEYPLLFSSIILAMSQIISLNAVSMLFVNYALPILLLLVVDRFFTPLISAIFKKIAKKKSFKTESVRLGTPFPTSKNGTTNSVASNYAFTLIHQLIVFLTPLAVTPHISRVLTSEGLGQYGYAYSIVSFFVIFANLGFTYYAQRSMAVVANQDKFHQSKLFFEIFFLRLISTTASLTLFLSLVLGGVFGSYSNILLVLIFEIISAGIDVSFFFRGKENFKIIALLQSFVKLVSAILIIVFIQSSSQLWLYALFMTLYSLFSGLIMVPLLFKQLLPVPLKSLNLKQHIKPSLVLFIPILAGMVYSSFIPTMAQFFISGSTQIKGQVVQLSDIENGYFSQADKVIQAAISVLTPLGVVMGSRNASLFAKNDSKSFYASIEKTGRFFAMLSLPMAAGVIIISNVFSPWFYGDGYEAVPLLLRVYSPAIIVIGFGNLLGYQTLVSQGRYRDFTISTLLAAGFALVFGPLFISRWLSLGSVLTVVLAQSVYVVFCYFRLRKELSIAAFFSGSLNYFIATAIMLAFGIPFAFQLTPSIANTIFLMLSCSFIYFFLLHFFHDSLYEELVDKITHFVFRVKHVEDGVS